MRTTRMRKCFALRFDSLESRALRAGGLTPNDPLFPRQWGLSNPSSGVDIDAPRAWAISTGSPSIVVADVGSSGMNLTHPDLAGKLWTNPNPDGDPRYPGALHGWNFVANNSDLNDTDGHGTNVAGIIAAASNNAQGIAGIAWGSPIMPLKARTIDQDAAAVRFAVDHGAKVINTSFSYHYSSPVTSDQLQLFDPLYQAIQYADLRGVVVVAAAGNSGIAGNTSGSGQDLATTPVYPAAFRLPNMITVAAVDRAGNLASFSNFGPTTVDLAAPGTDLTTTGLASQGNFIDYAAGTSFASPFVSGVAALVAAQHPEYSAEQVVRRIVSTTKALPGLAGKTISGGIVDAYFALKAGQPDVAPPSPPPPSTTPTGDLARGKPTFASSTEGPGYAPNAAVDGDSATRWSSGQWMRPGYVGWIYVDLGSPQPIGQVRLNWERAYGVDYQIQVSSDASSWTTVATVTGNHSAGIHDYGGLAETARYVRVYATRTSDFSDNYSLHDISIFATVRPDLARGKPAFASSTEGSGYAPAAAVDGDSATRWSSGQWMRPGYVGWIYVDLGSPQPIGQVRLNWERAYGVDYQIQVSGDASNWTTVATVTGNQSAGVHDYAGLAATARYVRVYATRTSDFSDNYSLYDLSVYS